MSATAYALKQVRRGDKLDRTFRFLDANRVPVDVSGLSFQFLVGSRGKLLFNLTTDAGTLTRGAAHEVRVVLSAEQTEKFGAGGVQSYELRVVDFNEAVMVGTIEGVDGLGALL